MDIKNGYRVAPFYYLFMVYFPILVAILMFSGLSAVQTASVAMGYAGLQVLWVLFFRDMVIRRSMTYECEYGVRISISGIIDMLELEWAKYDHHCKSCKVPYIKDFKMITDAKGIIDIEVVEGVICKTKGCVLEGLSKKSCEIQMMLLDERED